MATNPNRLEVSTLDFDDIKQNLRDFLKSQETFKDYNFEGTAADTILDVLAYITHYNAVNANLALNETFLDSAQVRASVVSHAKLLGYTPRSAFAPSAFVNVKVNNPTGVVGEEGGFLPLTMDRGTQYTTLIDGQTFTFVNENTLTTTRDSDGEYIFENVRLLQGEFKTTEYEFDIDTSERFILPFTNAVTSTLTVTIQASENSTQEVNFTRADTVVGLDSNSNVYFLQEGRDGFYEVYFGDGIVGSALENGNIIKLNYLVTDADAADGASQFSLADTIQGNSDVTITTISNAVGGSLKEDNASIKFNAPLGFVSQDRAVTPDDYKTIVQNNYANIDAITVWGGEDADPPDYGKVFISIKPKNAETVPEGDKQLIIGQYLKPKNVVSIEPVLVDPDFTYIYMNVFFKYNPNVTNLSTDALENAVRENIRDYNDSELKRFDGVFRSSNLLTRIDDTNSAVVNSVVRVYMRKRFVPTVGVEARYVLNFSSPIYTSSSTEQVIDSSLFTYRGFQCHLRDYIDTDNERKIKIVRGTGAQEIDVERDVGSIDESNGTVVLSAFTPESFVGDYIEVEVSPDSNDLAPKRNELLTILVDDLKITGEVDTMITGGTAAGIEYNTFSRHD